jgi:DNA-binding NtrC family response regulator
MSYLQSLPWPGNVRQLQHTIERAAIFSEHDEISCADCEVPLEMSSGPDTEEASDGIQYTARSELPDVRQAKSRVELDMIRDALQRFEGNKKKTAEYLGISRSHLYKKLAELGL